MPRFEHTKILDDSELAELRLCRDDLIAERADGPDAFVATDGPLEQYRRTIEVLSADVGGQGQPDTQQVVERFEYTLPAGIWKPLFRIPVARALKAGASPTQPWWAPADRLEARSVRILGLLCTLSLLDGYLGTVITQTMTFSADEFGTSDRGQGIVLASVRIGVLIAVLLMSLADRFGRRAILRWSAIGGVLLTFVGAFSPDMIWLGVSQAGARGFTTALGLLLIVIACEELPSRSRAYGLSVIVLSAALGAGMAVWVLPVADFGEKGWRVLYLLPALALPFLRPIWRRLPETRRFRQAQATRQVEHIGRNRLILLGSIGFLLAAFSTPASQFQNEFLRDERGFSGSMITLFTLTTTTPAGLAIFIGALWSDFRGRRTLAAVGAVGGALFTALAYSSTGSLLWTFSLLGTMVGALVIPALGVYGPEMFGTAVRSSANGYIRMVAVVGSATGLVLVGWLSDSIGSLGAAFGVMCIAPALVAIIVLAWLPETSGKTLEELNPR
ncbi:MAG: MFS transporter [Acidobacteria bacterium]|nr:MFS transporter [Acidobacteriota bacterium]